MRFNKILKAFPPPQYLNIPFAGLSISDQAIHLIQFSKKNDKFFIEKFKEIPLPPGVVTSGEVKNKEEVINILQTLKRDLKLDYIRVCISEERAYLFTAKIPEVVEKEVISAIESKIEENIPVNPQELIFDYKLFSHKEKNHIDVVVYALPIGTVNKYVEILESSNLTPLSLEIESQAVARALLTKNNKETILVVNFQPEKVGLYVTKKRVVRFSSTISLKRGSPNYEGLLLQEIKKLYVYWHALKENIDEPESKIEKIIICGDSIEENIVSYLSGHLEHKVVLGNVWTNVFDLNANIPEITFSDSLKYASAIGLSLSDDDLV
ncbi:MAG: hypothetical protein A3H52_02055 [Candidatus Zambryskibacteria bacterium RIFCSPLOWO2_02_FULL_39_26]|uniref:SHS2 domain-containing protein n=1 Tax=Candidatus Zambryskibacteria bacterium RIFCSPLOWO2_12_FULL_39_23 TaxID=1802776 RepID=A0A1G2URL4_9BACT|nr:MAG: hypothetical protein A2W51_02615 [Candidatus Zambryskibacteria bacterium RIFCSPHIGHO2_02_39_10]OHB09729.1 MAG: hypothetical protein A3H52_02055 [Candidatus Zambryskibacteria bacterium RIFCSPLOWO2_02_FULL_39_26]OHB12044.1 MAG: hypothetical protein A3G99_03015 [Candidatus Zambryskibacteria bacterium RIFCSPLOWO2_12_FULL_39_23]